MRFLLTLSTALGVLGLLPAEQANGCPPGQQRSLRNSIDSSAVILYGWVKNSQGEGAQGTTDFAITAILKSPPAFSGKQEVRIPRAIPVGDPQSPQRMLVFAEEYKGKLDYTQGIPVSPAFVEYFQGFLTIDQKNTTAVLRYCWPFMEHSDPDILEDALREFRSASMEELLEIGKELSPERLRSWLRDERISPPRKMLYGLLLGCCGDASDACLLRELVVSQWTRGSSAFEPLLGSIMLNPRDGWAQLLAVAEDPSREFMPRYDTLRAVRFFHNLRPEVVPATDRLAVIRHLIEQSDMCDLPIEDLRRWGNWSLTGAVLSKLSATETPLPIVRRAIIRYALCCPEEQARELIREVERKDPELIKDSRELLRRETDEQNAQKQ